MLLNFLLNNIYFNVFIFFINTSISDALFKSFYVNPSIISIARLLLNIYFILLFIYYILTKRINLRKYEIILYFTVFLGVSLIITPDKIEAIKIYINYVGLISYCIILFNIIDKKRVIRYLKNYANLVVILDFVAIFLLGSVGFMDNTNVIRGIHLSRSTLIIYLNLCILIYFYYIYLFKLINNRIKKSIIVMIFLSVFLILLSKSSTGIITTALFFPLAFYLNSDKKIKTIYLVSIGIAILLPLMNFSSALLNKLIEGVFGKSLTFSGRKYIWDYALSNFTSNPIIGNGFNSISSLFKNKVIPIYGRIASHSHNGFLDVFLQGGLVGLILILIILIVIFNKIRYFELFERKILRSYLITFIIFNAMEPYLLLNVSSCTLWLVALYIIIYSKREKEYLNEE